MKLLTKEELKGIDSTSKTIEKWDAFFKESLPRLGFRQSLIDNMYPYQKGIPMIDGSYLPVPKDTGRVFFKMSWADKLCGLFTICTSDGNPGPITMLKYISFSLWTSSFQIFKNFFKDETEETYNTLRTEQFSDRPIQQIKAAPEIINKGPISQRLWRTFISNSDLMFCGIHCRNYTNIPHVLPEEVKEQIIRGARYSVPSDSCLFLYCKLVEDVFTEIPKETIRRIVRDLNSYKADRLKAFDEVYYQDYLVVSLNPIDKFMCSTKQAFGSCMSIAKQDDVYGTNSLPAFGLPALFHTDSVFMVFLTPGKHKNMYWEEQEWKKSPDERDKEKAYKYLKMTCRALTYQGTPLKSTKQCFNQMELSSEDREKYIAPLGLDKPRLLVGRQYSPKGEDMVWQPMIEWLLARKGISTSMAYSDALYELYKNTNRNVSGSLVSNFLRTGAMIDNKAIVTDKYGYIRGIYYDNVSWSYKPGVREARRNQSSLNDDDEFPALDVNDGEHLITVGSSRSGSGGVTSFSSKASLDMFKVLTGKQDYSFINAYIKVCSICGKILTLGESSNVLKDERHICNSCMEKEGYKKCEICGELYSKDEAQDHEIYNVRELTNPSNYMDLEPIYICKQKLQKASLVQYADAHEGNTRTGQVQTGMPRARGYICAHCGRYIENTYTRSDLVSVVEFKGFQVRLIICIDCFAKATMCDKCKRLIFLDDINDPMLLLPNRRVICPDCIDSIRIKQKTREKLKEVLNNLHLTDLTEIRDIQEKDKNPIDDVVSQRISESRDLSARISVPLKNLRKQITSFLQMHPDKEYPTLRPSKKPLPTEDPLQEIEDLMEPGRILEIPRL